MASYALGRTRTASTGNPITFSYTVAAGDSAIVLLMKVDGGTNRAGGDPTLGPYTFLIVTGTPQKAAASPEASAELWYLQDVEPGTYTLTIPNSGGLNIFATVAIGRATLGGRLNKYDAGAANGTSADPAPNAISVKAPGIAFAILATGAQTWAPSAQVGTVIANTDDGTTGGGEQYAILAGPVSPYVLGWTFATSDDWGALSTSFREIAPNALQNYHTPSSDSAGVMSVGSIG